MEAAIFKFSTWVEGTEETRLRNNFSDLLEQCGFTILNFQEYYFRPQGYTALWLLAESHLAIHTFPEHNASYIELSSCTELYYKYFMAQVYKVGFKEIGEPNHKYHEQSISRPL